jgi:hypothetical protein
VGATHAYPGPPGERGVATWTASARRHARRPPAALDPSPELADAVAEAGLAESFEPARAAVAAAEPYQQALTSAGEMLGVLRLAIARAVVAEALAEQAEEVGAYTPAVPDAGARDRIVVLLVDALGGPEYGIPDLVSVPIRGLAYGWPPPGALAPRCPDRRQLPGRR